MNKVIEHIKSDKHADMSDKDFTAKTRGSVKKTSLADLKKPETADAITESGQLGDHRKHILRKEILEEIASRYDEKGDRREDKKEDRREDKRGDRREDDGTRNELGDRKVRK